MTCERHQLLPAEVRQRRPSRTVAAAIRYGAKTPELNQITLLTPSLLPPFRLVINPVAVSSQQRENVGEEEVGLQTPPLREPRAHSRHKENSNFEHMMGKFHIKKCVPCVLDASWGCQGQAWDNTHSTHSPPNSSFGAALLPCWTKAVPHIMVQAGLSTTYDNK